MVGVRMLKRRAKRCLHLLGLASGQLPAEDPQLTPFVCNVCGTTNCVPKRRVAREDGHCAKCECYGRLRSMMYALTSRFSPDEPILASMTPRKQIRGIGCSDWGYTALLAEKFDYINTFYDEAPKLDLCDVDWSRWPAGSIDFITCTDVLEHVAPPVDRAFENIFRLLKPGGVAILTVPCSLEPATREHFADLHDWRIDATDDRRRVLINRRRDGTIERYDDLRFHVGIGLTLEFRLFSRRGLIETVERAGLRVANLYDQPISPYALPLCEHEFVLVAEKPGAAVNLPDSRPADPYLVLCEEASSPKWKRRTK
jgi:SAM-dependent methyltransferase